MDSKRSLSAIVHSTGLIQGFGTILNLRTFANIRSPPASSFMIRITGMPVTCRIASSGFIIISVFTGRRSADTGTLEIERCLRPWR